jgi:putative molybdopterin biosynthesis protein
MKTLAEARALMVQEFAFAACLGDERVDVTDAVDRVLAAPVNANISSPNYNAAAMDGIAVKAQSTFGASEVKPLRLKIGSTAHFVNTGHVLPEETNAVIMIEHIHPVDDEFIEINAPAFPWQHVRKVGEDIVATEQLFARNHQLTPYCLGALLTAGVFQVRVKKRPRVLIIPTGSELVDWRHCQPQDLQPGQVIETNAQMVSALLQAAGCCVEHHSLVTDDRSLLREAVKRGVEGEYQIVLMVGGSSAGSEDFTRQTIAALGTILVHGVTMMPGKPVLIGRVKKKPVIGLPGYPVSAIIAFEQLVRPAIDSMLGRSAFERDQIAAIPTRKVASKLGIEEFLRVKLGKVGEQVVATPLPRGAGSITTFTEADGYIRIPNDVEGLNDGEPVVVELIRSAKEIADTVVMVGSHDNTIDILRDQLKADGHPVGISSSHVGSMGGIMAIKKGTCHIAGTHLLDPQDGSYNVSYIDRFLPDLPVKLVHLVEREQGLMVAKHNPKKIEGLHDLARDDVSFINRQSGSGTRILLDYRLRQLGLDPAAISGYQSEEFTHMAVAVAVLSGAVDAGLGIYAAAKALDLDFIPVVIEKYDLIIPDIHFAAPNIKTLLTTIESAVFKQRVNALGGYNTDRTGHIRH